MSSQFFMVNRSLLGTDSYTQAVYNAIKSHFPICYPGTRRLAELSGCSRPTVLRRIKILVSMGILKVVNRKRGQTSSYIFCDEYLTDAEKEAQRQGGWKGVAWRSFSRLKKVVNHSQSSTSKVVNPFERNKIRENKQEACGQVYTSSLEGKDRVRTSSEVLKTIQRMGRNRLFEAKAHMGDETWAVIKRLGGWEAVCGLNEFSFHQKWSTEIHQ